MEDRAADQFLPAPTLKDPNGRVTEQVGREHAHQAPSLSPLSGAGG